MNRRRVEREVLLMRLFSQLKKADFRAAGDDKFSGIVKETKHLDFELVATVSRTRALFRKPNSVSAVFG